MPINKPRRYYIVFSIQSKIKIQTKKKQTTTIKLKYYNNKNEKKSMKQVRLF